MWWITVGLGLLAIGLGARQLVVGLTGAAERDRRPDEAGPAIRLVRGAMYVTGGLFIAFFGLANLIALRNAAP